MRDPPAAKIPRIGFLDVGSREGRAFVIEGFLQGLREHGYVVGQNIVIEYRFSEGRNERLPELAAELIALKVDFILASGSPASLAAKQATRTIPIVMGSLAANPVETGFIASLARPGGNITGMTEMASQLSGKRLELLRATVPGVSRVAVFWNPPNPAYGPVLKELEAAAPRVGVKLVRLEVRVPEDFEGAFQTAIRQHAGALFIPGEQEPAHGWGSVTAPGSGAAITNQDVDRKHAVEERRPVLRPGHRAPVSAARELPGPPHAHSSGRSTRPVAAPRALDGPCHSVAQTVLDQLQAGVGVRTVFGEPIVAQERTVVRIGSIQNWAPSSETWITEHGT